MKEGVKWASSYIADKTQRKGLFDEQLTAYCLEFKCRDSRKRFVQRVASSSKQIAFGRGTGDQDDKDGGSLVLPPSGVRATRARRAGYQRQTIYHGYDKEIQIKELNDFYSKQGRGKHIRFHGLATGAVKTETEQV